MSDDRSRFPDGRGDGRLALPGANVPEVGLPFDEHLLAEMRALEAFRKRYLIKNPGAGVDREDPDVRKLLEALAFVSVRTRAATLSNLHASWRRLFGSFFDFLLHPLPAMAIAQATVTPRMTETIELAKGSELRVITQDGAMGSFELLSDLRIVPMTLERTEVLFRPDGFRVVLTFQSRFPRTDPVGLLRLYIYYLDDYLAALQIHYQFRLYLRRVLAVYNTPVDERTDGAVCQYSFGTHYDTPYEADTLNPLQQVREFLHFPQQDLFINVQVAPPRQAWKQLSICFDMSQDWPRDPPLYRDVFQPFAVPIRNSRRAYSQPILCDGTKDAYPIQHLVGDGSFELVRPRGVYELTQEGMAPLPPASLHGGRNVYEIEERLTIGEGDQRLTGPSGRSHFLSVRMPEALLHSRQLVVDGIWHQPGFGREAVGKLRVTPPDRIMAGVDWLAIGPIRPHQDSPLREDVDGLLRLLALKMKSTLTLSELNVVFGLLGALTGSRYADILPLLSDLTVDLVPDPSLRGLGIRHMYKVKVRPYEEEYEPLVWNFLMQVRAIVDAWNNEAEVTLSADTGGSPLRLRLKQPEGRR